MSEPGPDLSHVYLAALRRHAHQLLAEGYQRMDKALFSLAEEPTITGELIREMVEFMETVPDAPNWVDSYSIHDDPPVNSSGRTGKRRPRVDIEFERTCRGRRPRLCFEAKRLNTKTEHRISAYLGPDGLGCFLEGRYPTTHAEAGMLGYVQNDDEESWLNKILDELNTNPKKYAVTKPAPTRQAAGKSTLFTLTSCHKPNKGQAALNVHHVLLGFQPDSP